MTPAARAKLENIIQKIYSRKDAVDFRFPVDYEAFGKADQD